MALAVGAAILGTGGGGNPRIGRLRCLQELKRGREIRVISLTELADDAFVISVGGIGAPVIGIEKIEQGEECLRALRALEAHYGRKADALIASEIGGSNSMEPLLTGAQAGIPTVDADGMGRAFPEMQMVTFSIYGNPSVPATMADEKGNIVLFRAVQDELWFERLARSTVITMGGAAGYAISAMSGAYVKRVAVPDTVSQAIGLGRAVLEANQQHLNPIDLICRRERGIRLMDAKIVDLHREVRRGFAMGEVQLDGLGEYQGHSASVTIQNEYLLFRYDGEIKVVVPDLILLLDLDSGYAITTETLRYGQRVAVVALPCHALLRTPEALAVVGPAAFGITDVEYRPLP